MAAASPELWAAREAAKLACRLVAELCSACHVPGRVARDLLESLRARARAAPQLVSSWGAAPFLVFYASKAVEASPQALRFIACKAACPLSIHTPSLCPVKLDPTALGYAIYLAAILNHHVRTNSEFASQLKSLPDPCSHNTYFTRLVDVLIEYYMTRGRQHHLVYTVEHLSRLITIYTEPVAREVEETRNPNIIPARCRELGGGEEL